MSVPKANVAPTGPPGSHKKQRKPVEKDWGLGAPSLSQKGLTDMPAVISASSSQKRDRPPSSSDVSSDDAPAGSVAVAFPASPRPVTKKRVRFEIMSEMKGRSQSCSFFLHLWLTSPPTSCLDTFLGGLIAASLLLVGFFPG